ncbi:MAG: O-antigen ligase family protein [Elusimicrobiota bacterium]|nr:O-antigen ligase family protein [Elusimicrobiota bacterium]
MLAGLVGFFLAAGLLLRGAWDVWSQALLVFTLVGGVGVWLGYRAMLGYLPRPTRGVDFWAAVLAALSGLSATLSPVPSYSRPSWVALAAGLSLFPVVGVLSRPQRSTVDRWVRGAAWALVLVAAYQRLHGVDRPPSLLLNQNAFAGAALLLLPMALEARARFLAAGLVLCLWWASSVGAWLGLSVGLIAFRRRVGVGWSRLGWVILLTGLVIAYAKLQSPAVLHRLAWWKAAWLMAADAPWLGLGTGAFAYALPAYASGQPELSTLFAHQHLLESAAERGWPWLALWLAGLSVLLTRGSPFKRFGAFAALVHGLVDYPLSLPGVFWLFCYMAACGAPEAEEGVNVPWSRRPWMVATAACAVIAAGLGAGRLWRADRMRASAVAELSAPAPDLETARARLEESTRLFPHPESERLLAEVAIARAAASAGRPAEERAGLEEAADRLRRASRLDPYRGSNRDLLERVEARRRALAAAPGARP